MKALLRLCDRVWGRDDGRPASVGSSTWARRTPDREWSCAANGHVWAFGGDDASCIYCHEDAL